MLLLLDVDGPLNPWAARTPPPGYTRHEWRLTRRDTRHAHLNPAHDRFLHRRREVTALIPVDPATGITDAHLTAAEHALISPPYGSA